MKTVWIRRTIDAPPTTLWALLTDVDQWPRWGPSVRSAELAGGRFEVDESGTVTTIGGLRLGFVLTAVEPETRWTWSVAGVPATDHVLEPLGPERCRVGFGVPWPAIPYLAACWLALRRLDHLIHQPVNGSAPAGSGVEEFSR